MKKILLIEDDPSLQKVLAYNLNKNNFEVSIADDGEQALEILQSNPVDLILTDIVMPNLNGIQLYLKLKETDILDNTKIIFISGYEAELLQPAIADEPKLKRPYKWDDLLNLIKNHLEL